jgi:hypothetical protein
MKEYKESDYAELKELCLELGIPHVESFIDIEYAIDQDKEPKHLWEQPQRCHSWVRNAYNMFMSTLGGINMSDASPNWGTGYINLKDTLGNIISASTPNRFSANGTPSSGVYLLSPVNNDDYGILVGSDATAESFEHYGLQTQLTEPNVTHAVMPALALTQNGLTSNVAWSRTLTNASGGQLAFREVALVGRLYLGGSAGYYLLSRDLITPALTLNNTGYIIPTYTIGLTYPS